ncbi:MAG: glycosyltransferase [Rugosibacter sp.]|nr:MAG: glycosyltransferase [Rugosibacter sp.]TBR10388.1 MAG: glycosyltransferase [Rugosibacter sp.]
MIRILHVITDLGLGGAEAMLHKLIAHHDRGKFIHVVISLMDLGVIGARLQTEDMEVYTLDCKRGLPTWQAIRKLRNLARQLRPDIIQGWMYHGNLAAWLVRQFASGRPPLIWGIRQSLDRLSNEKWLTRGVILANAGLSHQVDAVVYNAHRSLEQHQALGLSGKTSLVIANGFDTNLFSPSSMARATIRAELQIPDTVLLVGLIGRFHPMKDHHGFLQAAAELVRHRDNVRFLMAGDGVDWGNPLLDKWVKQLKLAEHVYLLGCRDDITHLTAALDIAVSASARNEGFANVIGEAMSCSVPCVVTDVGDSAWIVGDTGVVVPPGNPPKLAEALEALLGLSADERQRMGMASRARAVAEFSIKQTTDRFEAQYMALAT